MSCLVRLNFAACLAHVGWSVVYNSSKITWVNSWLISVILLCFVSPLLIWERQELSQALFDSIHSETWLLWRMSSHQLNDSRFRQTASEFPLQCSLVLSQWRGSSCSHFLKLLELQIRFVYGWLQSQLIFANYQDRNAYSYIHLELDWCC